MISIESTNKRYRATLRETDNGVEVTLYDRGRCQRGLGRLVKTETVAGAFHVVRDAVCDLVQELPGYDDSKEE